MSKLDTIIKELRAHAQYGQTCTINANAAREMAKDYDAMIVRIRELEEEHLSVLSDWNELVAAIGAKSNGGAVGHAKALAEELQRVRSAHSSDRTMLLELMQAFDIETWQCPRCGHAEDTATMDSAITLRKHLQLPAPVAQPEPAVTVPNIWPSEDEPYHDGLASRLPQCDHDWQPSIGPDSGKPYQICDKCLEVVEQPVQIDIEDQIQREAE